MFKPGLVQVPRRNKQINRIVIPKKVQQTANFMLAFAEYERGTIVERTQLGKMVARQNPNFKDGHPKKIYADSD